MCIYVYTYIFGVQFRGPRLVEPYHVWSFQDNPESLFRSCCKKDYSTLLGLNWGILCMEAPVQTWDLQA